MSLGARAEAERRGGPQEGVMWRSRELGVGGRLQRPSAPLSAEALGPYSRAPPPWPGPPVPTPRLIASRGRSSSRWPPCMAPQLSAVMSWGCSFPGLGQRCRLSVSCNSSHPSQPGQAAQPHQLSDRSNVSCSRMDTMPSSGYLGWGGQRGPFCPNGACPVSIPTQTQPSQPAIRVPAGG